MARRSWKEWFARGLHDLGRFGAKGFVELQNAVYPGSNIAIPAVVSQAQLESQYQSGLDAAAARAAGPPEKSSEMEK